MKEYFPRSTERNSDTFFEEIKEVGAIVPHLSRLIHSHKTRVVDLYFDSFKTRMLKLYPGIEVVQWYHDECLKECQEDIKKLSDY